MRVLLVDDHEVVRAGLRRLLGLSGLFEVYEASTGEEGFERAAESRFDLIVLDLNLPALGGLELLRRLTRTTSAPVFVLSMSADPAIAAQALKAGARGYVSKNASGEELVRAIEQVGGGGRYVEGAIAQALAVRGTEDRSLGDRLTPRELEILRLLARGATLSEIATALGVSYKTVANGCAALKSRLGAPRTADLVRVALELQQARAFEGTAAGEPSCA